MKHGATFNLPAVFAFSGAAVTSIQIPDRADHTLGHIRYTPVGRLLATNTDLKTLIRVAYHVQNSPIVRLPAWTSIEALAQAD